VVPGAWRGGDAALAEGPSFGEVAWFEVYRDPVLTGLISTALTNAFEVRLAATRVEEAAAAYRVQRSALFPTLTGAGSWSRARVGDIPPAPGVTTGQFDVFGQLSYELDFWGRLRGLSAAGRARYLATEEARRVVRMGLISQVAVTYFQLRALDRQLEIARETLLSRRSLLEVVKARFAEENGLGFGDCLGLDVRQAETQVHAASASIARLERSVALAENALNLLMGRPPGPVSRGPALTEQTQPAGDPGGPAVGVAVAPAGSSGGRSRSWRRRGRTWWSHGQPISRRSP
jgi:multidrug efflux system outer membrane protein